MENISLADVSLVVTFLVSLIGSISYLRKNLKKWIANALEEQLQSIDKDIKALTARLDKVDMEGCKNYLVRCISEIDSGSQISETELERFWEQYGHYEKIGGNSYIMRKVEQLKEDGKL